MDQKIISQDIYDLFDLYVHDKISRREFSEKLSLLSLGAWTVAELFQHLSPDYGISQTKSDDPRLKTETIEYFSENGGGTIKAQLSRLNSPPEKKPGVIVVHENRGLNPYIEDVGRRLALEGYISCAPDALSPLGGYPGNDEEGKAMQRTRDKDEMLMDFIAAFEYLKNHDECTGKIGVIGFCFGGLISNLMSAMVPDLAAAVPYYGGQTPNELVENISCPLLLHYAELDQRVNEGWPQYEEALKNHQKDYKVYFYPGVNHGFHNDTTPRYDEAAAKLSWERSMEFFKKHL